MSNAPQFIAHIRELISKDKIDTAIQELKKLLEGSPRLTEVLQQSARYHRIITEQRLGVVDAAIANLEQNKISWGLLELLDLIVEEAETQPSIKEEIERYTINISVTITNNIEENHIINQSKNKIVMKQNHLGSGNNVIGKNIERQIKMGDGSTYIEQQNISRESTTEKVMITEPAKKTEETAINTNQKLPETPSGFFGLLFSSIPKPINWVIAVLLLGFAFFLAYQYFIPKKEEAKKIEIPKFTNEKVFVSGKIYINNGVPKLNEIARLTLRNIDANSAQISSTGQFTFENVKIPDNKRLLVNITFGDGKTIPTEELIVGEADKETKTVRLPDLYITRPLAAKSGRPATSWKIQVNVHKGNGELKATQN